MLTKNECREVVGYKIVDNEVVTHKVVRVSKFSFSLLACLKHVYLHTILVMYSCP